MLTKSVSHFNIKFYMQLMMVFLRENVWWRNNISFKKDIEKVVLLQAKCLKEIIVKFKAEKILFMFPSFSKHPFPIRKISCTIAYLLSKKEKLKIYISLKGKKLVCSAKSWGSLQVHDLVNEVSQGAYFFAVVQTCTKSLKKAYKKNFYRNSQFY